GTHDDQQYESEQILATTLFRIYQALGGDSNDVNKRWQASRVSTYLVLNAVAHCSPAGGNPATADDFYTKMRDSDTDDWAHEGYAGGAYIKVIRWSFEKQGLWRPAGAPKTQAGDPPAVDLYIDDGRGGEYQYKAVHWENASVWNRTIADGLSGEQSGVAGVQSYAYVKVKNRGTIDATGTVKVYHCLPGAGLTWPTDFTQAGPAAGISTGNVVARNGNEVLVGPFSWTPNVNAYGHDCLLAIVTTAQDPSNIDNLEAGQTIPEWRLVPHDNNIGQRNVTLVPGGGGGESLASAFEGVFFMAGNNFNKPAQMEIRVEMPKVLAGKGWRLQSGNTENKFQLKAGEKREIRLQLIKGGDFTADEIRSAGRNLITVSLYGNGMLMGGMTYHVDPDMIEPAGGKHIPGRDCRDKAQDLLDCLDVSGNRKVKKVCVTKITIDFKMEGDCGCD
ncbi:MAG TPA: hypothetical protein VK327_14520, partial [Candidatus Paceibacterota bacterium]|nr:hypothetical protein [Candidatus Paceibacterota bacterium]